MSAKILRLKGVTASVVGDISTEGKIYVTNMVDGEPIFGGFEDAYRFDGNCMRGNIKGLDIHDIQHKYNWAHNNKLEDVNLPGVMGEGDRITYICDLKGYNVVRNSKGYTDNLKFVVGAHINKENGNTAIMTYKIWMFEKGVPDYMCEEYDDYATAVARYNVVAAEYDSNFGKYAHLKKK